PNLNGKNFAGQAAQHGGLITKARPDFQDPLVACKGEGGSHGCDDIRLRDCLAPADRQRSILISAGRKIWRNEFMAGNSLEAIEHSLVMNVPAPNLLFYHFVARGRERIRSLASGSELLGHET